MTLGKLLGNNAPLFIFSSSGRDQSSLCDTLLSVCPSVHPSVRLSVRKQFLLSHYPLRLFITETSL